MRTWLPLVVALVLAVGAKAEEAAAPAPHDVIRKTGDDLLAVIEEGKGYFDNDPERFYTAVQGVLDPVIDFDSFSRGVMAVHYRKATPAQRTRFRDSFKNGLVRTYGKALLNYGDEKIEVLPADRPPPKPDRESVTMNVWSEGKVYPVIYSMARDASGRWRMRNIIINGINMGLTYRNQFASAMKSPQSRGDLDKVIDEWSSTIANVDPMAEDADKAEASSGAN
jgi:phospholipid transport system substrate-binding protein